MCVWLSKASFGLWVLSLPLSVHPSIRHQVCPRKNPSPVQARTITFGPKMQNTLVKVPIVLGGNQPWHSRSNLRSKSKFTPFWACPHYNSSPNQAKITKFGPEVQNTFVKIPIVLGGNWPRVQGQIWLKKPNFLASPLLEIHNHHITTREPWVPRLLHRPDCFIVSILCMYLYS